MTRFLAIDLGDKRTGLAVGDDETRSVFPLEVIEAPMAEGAAGERLLAAIAKALGDHRAAALVVGLPFNMDGTEGARAKLVRAFAARAAQRTGAAMHFQDERLTSAAADWEMSGSGLTRGQKKHRRDALAAAAILRDFLSRQSPDARAPAQP